MSFLNSRLKKFPKTEKYFGAIILKRSELKRPDKSNYIKLFTSKTSSPELFEELLADLEIKVDNFESIFDIESELNPKLYDIDGRINDLVAELIAAKFLINEKFENIEKSVTPDFVCEKDGLRYGVEVKFMRGESFKKSSKIGMNLAYKLNSKLLMKDITLKLKSRKIKNQLELMKIYDKSIIIVITNRLVFSAENLSRQIHETLDLNYKNLKRIYPNLEEIIFIVKKGIYRADK